MLNGISDPLGNPWGNHLGSLQSLGTWLMKVRAWEDLVERSAVNACKKHPALRNPWEKQSLWGSDEHQCMGGFGKECPATNNSTRVETTKIGNFLTKCSVCGSWTLRPLFTLVTIRYGLLRFLGITQRGITQGYYAEVLRTYVSEHVSE